MCHKNTLEYFRVDETNEDFIHQSDKFHDEKEMMIVQDSMAFDLEYEEIVQDCMDSDFILKNSTKNHKEWSSNAKMKMDFIKKNDCRKNHVMFDLNLPVDMGIGLNKYPHEEGEVFKENNLQQIA